MSKDWKKVVARKACDIIDADKLSAGSRALLNQEDSPRKLVSRLVQAEKWPDAIAVLTHALPRREAVWWACVCCRSAGAEDDIEALEAAEKWVFKPSAKRRVEAFREVQESSSSSAGALVALAVVSSEGRLRLDEDLELKLQPSAFAQTVAAAIMVAADSVTDEQGASPFKLFIEMGEDIARGGNGHVDKE